MPTSNLLDLPPVSPELKPILPFLQRAEELKKQEPIVAYWCAYYAAQVGISLKARDNASRDVLFNLLGVLESMKKEIGNVDAIEIEAASAAYVENFALKIFHSADNEDRKGVATRTTAKKFLAASNFLEVLKTFPKAEVSETNEEKIRYAKWKAADIAKALREGRRPTPGPANQEQDFQPSEEQPLSIENTTASSPDRSGAIHLNSQSSVRLPSPPTTSHDTSYGSPPKSTQGHRRSGSDSSTHSGSGSSKSKKAWVSEELEGKVTSSSSPPRPSAMKSPGRESSPEGKKKVHFSSSAEVVPPSAPPAPPLPPKVPSPSEVYQGPPSIYAPHPEKTTPSPPSIPPTGSSPPRSYNAAPSSASYSPPRTNIYASPTQSSNYGYSSSPPKSHQSAAPIPPPSVTPPRSVELTPSLVAKVQKHCRFAISSLDYEDAEQAKKELRTALALLGGL